MIVDYFNFVRIATIPGKANAILIINPNAVLSLAIAFKLFEMIAWRHSHVFEPCGGVKHRQLSSCNTLRLGATRFTGSPDALGFSVGEALGHYGIITTVVNNVKRY